MWEYDNITKIYILARWDASKPDDYYESANNKRTLEGNSCVANRSTGNFGCIKKPLLNIPIKNIKVDELHLLLPITGDYLYIFFRIETRRLLA